MLSRALARSIDSNVAARRVPKVRDVSYIVAGEVGSRWELYREVGVGIEVGGEAIDEDSRISIVAVSGSYTDVAVQEVLEIQNSTLRGARRR